MRVRTICITILTIPLLVSGCGYLSDRVSPTKHEAVSVDSARLKHEVLRWQGTPYRFGGTNQNGIDCSAFAKIIYRDVYGIEIPRTTGEQVAVGKRIDFEKIATGDLVFFLPESKKMHMGIYLGRGEFAHASASRGVMVSNIDTPYWKRIFLTARRLLDL